ncbi:response regulator [Roseibium denhamense]|uniref:histidine kinase n=1 Tax=Roseibium denhamense TaxID=76305 RepID=A0ABY1P969_9HYPH|nr:hybrid sensor histidine kinase/response regulator [Roseibium denhamense]MTI07391.1 response regulator [Roseibium denhamense]SMP29332.1 His Kinase A (phospho-acceptor) domain-containing protein [Roseibium denhamense]
MADQNEDSVKLALLAHDLRTPLAAMRLTAELIERSPLTDTQKDQISILIKSIDALTHMTGELIQTASPAADPQPAECRVAAILGECTDLFAVSAKAKGLRLILDLAEGAKRATTTFEANLRRVVMTLLDNAIKYTGSGTVIVSADLRTGGGVANGSEPQLDQQWICVSVTDKGPGITSDEQGQLFQPFARGEHGLATAPGSGLGLWGAAELTHEMGGQLELRQPDDGGSRFEIHIPVGLLSDDAADVPERNGEAGREPPEQLPCHVLIVDDNETNCRLLSALLESFGATADTARSGEQAIGLVRAGDYDAVFLDLHMPGMSGLETAEELRTFKSADDLPLVAVTAALETVGDQRLKKVGFQDVLAKPLSPSLLYDTLSGFRRGRS